MHEMINFSHLMITSKWRKSCNFAAETNIIVIWKTWYYLFLCKMRLSSRRWPCVWVGRCVAVVPQLSGSSIPARRINKWPTRKYRLKSTLTGRGYEDSVRHEPMDFVYDWQTACIACRCAVRPHRHEAARRHTYFEIHWTDRQAEYKSIRQERR